METNTIHIILLDEQSRNKSELFLLISGQLIHSLYLFVCSETQNCSLIVLLYQVASWYYTLTIFIFLYSCELYGPFTRLIFILSIIIIPQGSHSKNELCGQFFLWFYTKYSSVETLLSKERKLTCHHAPMSHVLIFLHTNTQTHTHTNVHTHLHTHT